MKISKWVDELVSSTEKFMQLETTEGVTREGRISGFTFFSFEFNGRKVEFPIEIEVNGDPNDRIPVNRITNLSIFGN